MEGVSVILLLGSNDIEAQSIVSKAASIIDIAVGKVVNISQSYRSKAYGFTSDREFVNQAVEITSTLDAYEVLRRINLIEALLGRDRKVECQVKAERNEAYASRPIDIDIIFYGDMTFDDSRLTIPYHFLDEREYALRPVVDIAPERKHSKLSQTPRQMLEALINKM
jgi:2-amino-4-hydroxy-6-hydroxymethyldihydropteridine diphosphokinase